MDNRDPSRHRRQTELHGEQKDQQQSPPENRHRIAGKRNRHDAVVEDRIPFDGGEHSRGQAEDQREQHRRGGELDGCGKQRLEFGDHRRLSDDRFAEITLQHAAEIVAILHVQRLIEAEFLQQLGVMDRIDAALARHRLDRIAGHETDQEERNQRDSDKGRNDETDAGQDEAQHDSDIALRP